MVRTAYCTSGLDVNRILTDPRNNLQDYKDINPHLVRLQYSKKDEFVEDIPHTNGIIAAFVTCYARLKLYDYLAKLDDCAIYCDTDSVFYYKKPGFYEVPIGNYLGDMKDELEGRYVTEFVAAGPKSYAYAVSDNTEVVKMKGFS